MRIRTQFFVGMALFGIIMAVILASVVITNRELKNIDKQEGVAASVSEGAIELGYLSNDYVVYRESHQLDRWETRFASFSAEVDGLRPASAEQQVLVNNIRASTRRLKEVFDSIGASAGSPQGQADISTIQVAWSRMAVQTQGLASDASRLSVLLRSQAQRLREVRAIVSYTMVGVFGAYFLVVFLWVQRRALKPIARLQESTAVVGSGRFDFKIEEGGADEIGDLSRAFNQMTAKLKTVTASKADLEKQVLERAKAEEALRESEQRWATTLSSIGDAVIATDTDGKVTFINKVAEEMTGWSLSEAARKPIGEVFPIVNEESGQAVENPISNVLESGKVVGLANHTILVRRDGARTPIDDSAAPIKSEDGRTTGVVLIFRDITERKKAERETAYLASFPRLNPNPVCEVSATGTVNFANQAAQRIFPDLLARGAEHPFFAGWQDLLTRLGPNGPAAMTREVKVGDWWYLQGVALVPATGVLRFYTHNITERRRAEIELRESEERFSRAFHDSPVASTITAVSNGRWVDVNENFLRMMEYSREEVIGHDSAELKMIAPEERERILGIARRGGTIRNLELKLQTKSGRVLTVLSSNQHILLNGQDHLISTVLDITERKKAEEEVRRLNRELRALSDCNQAIVRASDEQTLFTDVCRTMCEAVGYRMACVGSVEHDEAKSVRPCGVGRG